MKLQIVRRILVFAQLLLSASLLATPACADTNGNALKVQALYPCRIKLVEFSSTPGMKDREYSRNFDVRNLKDDFFLIVNESRREIYIYTPFLADKFSVSRSKDGIEIKTMMGGGREQKTIHYGPDGEISKEEKYLTRDRPRYHIRLPYKPKGNSAGHGYYYLTFYDTRLQLSPRFIAGEARRVPNFSSHVVTPTTDKVEFHSLPGEEKMWGKLSNENFSVQATNLLIRDMLDRIYGLQTAQQNRFETILKGSRWATPAPLSDAIRVKYTQKYIEVLESCRTTGEKASIPSLVAAVDDQTKTPVPVEDQLASEEKWAKRQMNDSVVVTVQRVRGRYFYEDLYPVLNRTKVTLKECLVANREFPETRAALRVEFDIDRTGAVIADSIYTYSLHGFRGNFKPCLKDTWSKQQFEPSPEGRSISVSTVVYVKPPQFRSR